MNIDTIKEELLDHIGDEAIIKCNLGRNKIAEYNVTIKKTYDYIFLVEVKDKSNSFVKSFSYSDVITKTINIDYCILRNNGI